MKSSIYGKKIFFLNPPPVIDEVFPVLAGAEFEVYKVKDHVRLAKYLSDFQNALYLFILMKAKTRILGAAG